jgi:uncharacterized protein YjbI with pentapeptide repeats
MFPVLVRCTKKNVAALLSTSQLYLFIFQSTLFFKGVRAQKYLQENRMNKVCRSFMCLVLRFDVDFQIADHQNVNHQNVNHQNVNYQNADRQNVDHQNANRQNADHQNVDQ